MDGANFYMRRENASRPSVTGGLRQTRKEKGDGWKGLCAHIGKRPLYPPIKFIYSRIVPASAHGANIFRKVYTISRKRQVLSGYLN